MPAKIYTSILAELKVEVKNKKHLDPGVQNKGGNMCKDISFLTVNYIVTIRF